MDQPDFQGAIEHARQRMAEELAPDLVYHSLVHTFDDVLPAAMHLADYYQLNDGDRGLLAVAVALHDIGWVIQGQDHERVSANIARQALPAFGFSRQQIDQIVAMILATRLPQSPHNLLEEILVDADLDVLGRDDFWPRSQDLRREMANGGNHLSDSEWYTIQLEFLESHAYFTEAARRLRGAGEARHLREMRQYLALARAGENDR